METALTNDVSVQATPIDAISGILAAFETHSVVALDEGNHTNEQGHAFRLSLIRHPKFSTVVDDIVVEFGNALYQDIVDRFVNGDDVPDAELCQIWQNTMVPGDIWDKPIYEEFFRAVRDVNLTLSKKLRILLGDPPVDWKNYGPDTLLEDGIRNSHPANLIQREVLANSRRALVIYGGMHFLRKVVDWVDSKDETFILAGDVDPSIVERLESQSGRKVFTIWTHTLTPWNLGEDKVTVEAGLHLWPNPSLAKFRGTTLGALNFSAFYPGVTSWRIIDDVQRSLKARPNVRIEEQFDALLYLGPPLTITYSELPVKRCTDVAYIEMRSRRAALFGDKNWAINFKEYCDKKMRSSITSTDK